MKSYDLEITRVVTIHHYFPPNLQEPLNLFSCEAAVSQTHGELPN